MSDIMDTAIGTTLDDFAVELEGHNSFVIVMSLVQQHKLNYKTIVEKLFAEYPYIATEIVHTTMMERIKKAKVARTNK